MWERRSDTFAPLTNIKSSKVKFKWTITEQDASNEVKRIVAHDTLLAYPDFNEEFKIHTDARNFQLGAVIKNKAKPITLYGTKLLIPRKGIS